MANVKATDLIDFTRASKGHALAKVSYGSELVVNGTFDSDLSDWTDNVSKWSVSGSRAYHAPNSTFAVLRQSVPLTVGKVYRITFDYEVLQGELRCQARDSSNQPNSDTLAIYDLTGTGSASVIFVPDSDYDSIGFARDDVGVTSEMYVDNVSVKEVLFNQTDGTLQLFEHPNNIPRIEYDADGNLLGLLIEEARTNQLTYSNDFSQWVGNGTSLTATTETVSPDGQTSAYKVVPTTATNAHFFEINSSYPYIKTTTSGTNFTYSIYAKAAEYDVLQLASSSGFASKYQNFDLTNGVKLSGDTDRATIEYVGNGWYRCSVTQVTTSSTNGARFIAVPANSDITRNALFTGDGSSGIYIFGAQAEENASLSRSYIKTQGSTVSRAADVASIDVDQFGYNQSEGTITIEATTLYPANLTNEAMWKATDGTTENRIEIYQGGSGNPWPRVHALFRDNNSTTQTLLCQTNGWQSNNQDFEKVGFAYKAGDSILDTETDDSPSFGTAAIPQGITEVSFAHKGHIKSITYTPKRLSNAKLQELTT